MTFELKNEREVKSLGITLQEFEHKKTGATHIHMASESEENVFLVALRTVPTDSTGVAHILEHTALCGSKKYPVRDPFFMMTRRSLNTFMNAFTSSDWTGYPFASFNKKDFNNLLDVYLDAVFFTRIDPLDFAQEGHRLEFKEATNPKSDLEFKGVVFNEMKGAMSSVSSQLWHTLTKYLFPSNTYHFNSGGEPEDIPNLSYDELKDFYQTHYHPTNATFFTFGNIPAIEHQEKFENQVLNEFERSDKFIHVENEKRYFAPLRIEEAYPNNEEDLSEKTHVVMSWLLGESTNLQKLLQAQLLSSVLMDNSASPLMHALESTDLGNAPSPLCGLDDSQKELTLVCGLADCKEKSTDEVEALINKTLENIAENGVPAEDIEACLHQIELQQREISGGSYPFGLSLILKSLTSAIHRGDPANLLDIDKALESLREDIKQKDFIQNLIKELVIDNPHRVTLTMVPNAEIAARKIKAEEDRLENIKNALSAEETQSIIDQAQALKERQEAIDDPGVLPKVSLSDVPSEERDIDGTVESLQDKKFTSYNTGTNGLNYQQIIYNLPQLNEEELKLLPLYSSIMGELGAGDDDYLEFQKRQSAVSGGISSSSSLRNHVDSVDKMRAFYVFSGKALNEKFSDLSCLIAQLIQGARFDEHARIRELMAQIRISSEQSITGSGHILAMNAASAGSSASSRITHELSGLASIQHIKAIDNSFSDSAVVAKFALALAALHQKITGASSQLLLINDQPLSDTLRSDLNPLASLGSTNPDKNHFSLDHTHSTVQQAWITNTQVNFCALSYPTVSLSHEDAAPLVALGNFLRNGHLHTAIREQGGAYGGGASQDSSNACFRFYSYRDPRMSETLDDFKASITWLKENNHAEEKLEEALMGAVGGLDRSESPASQAKRCFQSDLHQRSAEVRKEYRERLLACTQDDVIRVAETYLKPENASCAVITNQDATKQVEDLGLDIITL
ncbi:MAG: Zn-dependent M16 (insulinase) family peptidase [Flavobacteriales bacterium]|jgi:Zn-dependent M16 (insulinase) family peptidase